MRRARGFRPPPAALAAGATALLAAGAHAQAPRPVERAPLCWSPGVALADRGRRLHGQWPDAVTAPGGGVLLVQFTLRFARAAGHSARPPVDSAGLGVRIAPDGSTTLVPIPLMLSPALPRVPRAVALPDGRVLALWGARLPDAPAGEDTIAAAEFDGARWSPSTVAWTGTGTGIGVTWSELYVSNAAVVGGMVHLFAATRSPQPAGLVHLRRPLHPTAGDAPAWRGSIAFPGFHLSPAIVESDGGLLLSAVGAPPRDERRAPNATASRGSVVVVHRLAPDGTALGAVVAVPADRDGRVSQQALVGTGGRHFIVASLADTHGPSGAIVAASSTDGGRSWTEVARTAVGGARALTAAATSDGRVVAAWRADDQAVTAELAEGGWTTPTPRGPAGLAMLSLVRGPTPGSLLLVWGTDPDEQDRPHQLVATGRPCP